MSNKPSTQLISLADKALRLKMKSDEAAAAYKEAQEALYTQLEAEKMLDPDTHGLGDLVKVSIVPNRKFNIEIASKLVTKKVLKECEVTTVDSKLLQQHLTPIQKEQAMEFFPKKYKLSVSIAD